MDRRIEIVISEIERDPQGCQLSELAESVNLSSSRLRHLFKQETGITPLQHLKRVRFEHAALLLRTTFFSIKEVMRLAGFNDISHFGREFKKLLGKSPGDYREAYSRETVSRK